MKAKLSTPADYGMQIRLSTLETGKTTQEKADNLNLIEDILDSSRSIDDVVEAFLRGDTPKVYQPK